MPKKKTPDHFLDQMQNLADEISSETDRGTVILCASMLEEALGLLIKTSFHKDVDDKTTTELFFGNGAFATFSSRTKVCFALGYISKDEFDMLNVIRSIRNDFAHFKKDMPSLSNQSYSQRIENISKNYHLQNTTNDLRMIFAQTSAALTIVLTHQRVGMITRAEPCPLLNWTVANHAIQNSNVELKGADQPKGC